MTVTIGRPRLDKKPQGTRDGKLQCELVKSLAEHIPGFQERRWREQMVKAFTDSEEVQHAEDDFRSYLFGFKYVPDGFVIDREDRRVDFFEVEITSLMTRTKLQAYGEFTTIMDFYGIEVDLYTVNQHGHINLVPLLEHYLEFLNQATATPIGE